MNLGYCEVSNLKVENPLKELVSLKNVCMFFSYTYIYKFGKRISNKIFFNCKRMFIWLHIQETWDYCLIISIYIL